MDALPVDVTLATLDAATARLGDCLSEDERARATRFAFESDRERFVAGRAVLRTLAGRVLGVAPEAVAFRYEAHGKPQIDAETDVRFNVSHSGGLGLFAFTRGAAVGVDIERERPMTDLEAVARRFFSVTEREALFALPAAERPAAFFRCWSRKEAFIKATGDGLRQPLDAFDVAFANGAPARLLRLGDDTRAGERWWMQALEVPEGFAGALVVEGGPRQVVQRPFVLS